MKSQMLKEIGVASIEDLYADVPRAVRPNRPLRIDSFNSEQDVKNCIDVLLAKNRSANDHSVFLGAGTYNHYIPAVVKAVMGRTEFQTSYTPYQAEVSQGLLQALFEFQSLMADLTNVDAVNSSLYDGSTALGEAARMAVRATGRKTVLVPKCLHPDKHSVLKNYTDPIGVRVESFDYDPTTGSVDMSSLESKLDNTVAAVYSEVPSFFGILDPNIPRVPSTCHGKGALSIIGFDPISLGGLKPPGEYGADIIVAEGQSISSEMNFGGPSLGIIGCRGEQLVRQLPGRLIGMTTTLDGKDRGFSMVLQTREQHIRREKATSNICTNEALLAVGAATYLSLLGPKGLRQLFETILTKTEYAIKRLGLVSSLKAPRFSASHYQEFVITVQGSKGAATRLQRRMLAEGIHCGRNLAKDFPELGESLLLCVTELLSDEAIDRLALLLDKLSGA